MKNIHAVLFDLDGTLLDTAPDLVRALNAVRKDHGRHELPLNLARPLISHGSRSLIKYALDIDENHPEFNTLRTDFFTRYEENIASATTFFPGVENVLTYLDQHHIPWGIVTNKLTHHTIALLKALRFDHRPHCIVCGDTLTTYKPDPAPIRYACELLKVNPINCLYVGDSASDVIASKAAETKSLVALYGYLNQHDDPYTWHADGYIKNPLEIIEWLTKYLQQK